jgi:hypothetical protein
MSGARVEILVRGRFLPFPEATVRHVRANAHEVKLPFTAEIERRLRGALDADEIVASLDGVEATQAILTGESADSRTLVLLLP